MKKIFYNEGVNHRTRLPRDVMDAPSPETLMARLDWALSTLI